MRIASLFAPRFCAIGTIWRELLPPPSPPSLAQDCRPRNLAASPTLTRSTGGGGSLELAVTSAGSDPHSRSSSPSISPASTLHEENADAADSARDRSKRGSAEQGAAAIAPLLADTSFDPELIATLVTAYEAAWDKIEKSGSLFASPRYRRVAQEIIAKRIIDTAQQGEIHPLQLADDAVSYLSESYV